VFYVCRSSKRFCPNEAGALIKKHAFELASEISYRIYEEPDVMKEKGMMYGLVGSYTYRNKIMLKVEGRGSWGGWTIRTQRK